MNTSMTTGLDAAVLYGCNREHFAIAEFSDSLLVYDRRNGDTHQLTQIDAYLFETLSDALSPLPVESLQARLAEDLVSDYHPFIKQWVCEALNRLQDLFLVECAESTTA